MHDYVGQFGEVQNAAQLRAELTDVVERLRYNALQLKITSEVRGLAPLALTALVLPGTIGLTLVSDWGQKSVAGWDTMFGIIDAKQRSIDDVINGSLALDKWINGVEVFRVELENFCDYVNDSASWKSNLRQLAIDLATTARQFGVAIGGAGIGLAIGALALAVLLK